MERHRHHCAKRALAVMDATAESLSIPAKNAYMASTGVIGEPLKAEKVVKVLPKMVEKMKHGKWETAAKAISTTDTFPKGAGRTAEIEVYAAQHGWCVTDSPVYDEAEAERAWARLLANLEQHL